MEKYRLAAVLGICMALFSARSAAYAQKINIPPQFLPKADISILQKENPACQTNLIVPLPYVSPLALLVKDPRGVKTIVLTFKELIATGNPENAVMLKDSDVAKHPNDYLIIESASVFPSPLVQGEPACGGVAAYTLKTNLNITQAPTGPENKKSEPPIISM